MLDSASLGLFCLIVVTVMIAVGLIGNGFITIANCYDWRRRKTLSSSDMIALVLSLSRFLFLGITLSMYCLFFLDTGNQKCLPTIMIYFWAFSNAASLWIATVLVVFYCMKIVHFTQPFLVKMKLRISRMVLQILLGSLMISLFVALPIFWFEHCNNFSNGTKIPLVSSNGTRQVRNFHIKFGIAAVLYFVGTLLPAIIYLISSVFLIVSLVHHVKKMQRNTESFPDQRTAVHVRTVKVLVSFLILYSAGFASEISITLFPSVWTYLVSTVVISGYHLGHAITLIVMDSKLKQTLNKVHCDALRQCLSKTLS
ncbi:taste receptor type 2 member 9-like [Sceloporus undulatus]|uniref:taste receptor type 2 member 9-like n=1 Tax=Sceloporus undulatus TaxID=8520 RepID=UPI001C4D237E|nr:taste receptor type 2 member 9-like [Sceloporus undulatus]